MVNPNLFWEVIGESVRGASHCRSGVVNQDNIYWHPESASSDTVMIAVSDGHGSPRCFRSDWGAWFAVKAAIGSLKRIIFDPDTRQNLLNIRQTAKDRLPHDITMRWRRSVESHFNVYPFSESESQILKDHSPFYAYGATVISVCITPWFILYNQLGDGDILTVSAKGKVERPLPADTRLFANETTSLCAAHAWADFRFLVQTDVDNFPDMILLSTDGYANSFQDDSGFMKAAQDVWEMLRSEGRNYVRNHLEEWLNETSEGGSGDDITVGLIIPSINRVFA
jgi:serine/threonine protein phosphatase PrpC